MPGVEPGSQAWEACMMPLHYMRFAIRVAWQDPFKVKADGWPRQRANARTHTHAHTHTHTHKRARLHTHKYAHTRACGEQPQRAHTHGHTRTLTGTQTRCPCLPWGKSSNFRCAAHPRRTVFVRARACVCVCVCNCCCLCLLEEAYPQHAAHVLGVSNPKSETHDSVSRGRPCRAPLSQSLAVKGRHE